MKPLLRLAPLTLLLLTATPAAARNIVVFVADGLRYGSVTPETAPNMDRLRRAGVDFANSHSLLPTLTTVNAAVIATGHYPGDTGNFGNMLYAGAEPLAGHATTLVPDLEDNRDLEAMKARFAGNYLGETSLLAAARAAGFQTAAIGKVGPTRIQDLTARADGSETLILDDAFGGETGYAVPDWFAAAMPAAFLPAKAPARSVPNVEQEVFLMKATTRIVLPRFKASGKPFALVFWSRDPDATQHDAKDSVGEYMPGINGVTALASVRNADAMLGELLAALKAQGLEQDTDVFVTADHGFLTIARDSATSPSAKAGTAAGEARELAVNFLARDLGDALGLKVAQTVSPTSATSVLGADPAHPRIVVASNGGADLIYLPGKDARALGRDIVKALSAQDYTSGIFASDRLGRLGGTLPLSAIALQGAARTPVPDLVVSFRSFTTGCADATMCAVGVVEGSRRTGQGSHGAFNRATTRNFMAAIGPDFRSGHVDRAPVSNADIAPTLAKAAGLTLPARGKLTGRVLTEAMPGGAEVVATTRTVVSAPGPGGLRTVVREQAVGGTRYFDAAGFEGRSVGLERP